MTTQQNRKPSPAEAIYLEARSARQTSERILTLLDQPDDPETSPLDEIKGLLEAIVTALRHQSDVLGRLEAVSGSVPPPGLSQSSTSAN